MRSNVTPRRLLVRLYVLTAMLTMVLTQAFAADPNAAEYLHKAKIIKSIIQMVGWPAGSSPKDNFTVCVAGNLPYMKEINTLEGTTIAGHKIAVKRIPHLMDAKDNCQLVYAYELSPPQLDAIIKFFNKKPVLLLGDMESFALRGGSMNFTHLNNVLALTVNMDSMKNSNLFVDLKIVDRITVIPQAKDLAD